MSPSSTQPPTSGISAPLMSDYRSPTTPGFPSFEPSPSAPLQSPYSFGTHPSSMQPSPTSSGPASRSGLAAPLHHMQAGGGMPTPVQYGGGSLPRPGYSYQSQMPVMSNIGNPGGHMSLLNGSMAGGAGGGGAPRGYPFAPPGHHGYHVAHHQGPQSHHQERPFKCDICAQAFNRNHDLKRHKRIHLAVKPFPCNNCDKSFSRKDALKRHRLVKGCREPGNENSGDEAGSSGLRSGSANDGSVSPQPGSESTN